MAFTNDSDFLKDQKKSEFYSFIDESKVVEMPGIDYEKIELYRAVKHCKKFTSMTDLPYPGMVEPTSLLNSLKNISRKNKHRYKSI
jgi:hypothetical protein